MRPAPAPSPCVTLAIVAGCAWPDDDGRAAARRRGGARPSVTVADARQVVLDQPYAAVRRTPLGHARRTRRSPRRSKAHCSAPRSRRSRGAEATFTLYFVEGQATRSTDESKRSSTRPSPRSRSGPVPDVLVIGHTDTRRQRSRSTTRSSRQRAETVRAELIRRGVGAARRPGDRARQARAGRADRRRRRRAAQPARRDHRPLSAARIRDVPCARPSARPPRPAAGPVPAQRQDGRGRRAGSAPAANACTSACSASTSAVARRPARCARPREHAPRAARAPYSAPCAVLRFGDAVGDRGRALARLAGCGARRGTRSRRRAQRRAVAVREARAARRCPAPKQIRVVVAGVAVLELAGVEVEDAGERGDEQHLGVVARDLARSPPSSGRRCRRPARAASRSCRAPC